MNNLLDNSSKIELKLRNVCGSIEFFQINNIEFNFELNI